MSASNVSAWVQMQAKRIAKDLQQQHGAGWRHLSEHQRDAYRAAAVLNLLLGFALDVANVDGAEIQTKAREVLAQIPQEEK